MLSSFMVARRKPTGGIGWVKLPATEDELAALLKPSPDASLKIWPILKMVGNVKNNGPHLALPDQDGEGNGR